MLHIATHVLLSLTIFTNLVLGYVIGQTVLTSSGPVQGHAAKSATSVSEYLGIPYAESPTGALRFALPEPFKGDGSLIKAEKFSLSCPANPSVNQFPANLSSLPYQFTSNGVAILSGQDPPADQLGEDCLTLNVWTKPQTGESKKAVMVWIYGGGFVAGSSSINGTSGEHLASEHDVVLVSFNYRTNIFGFPGHPSGKNNLGLYDQRLAIEWVRDNIEVFGGDPRRITIFGESAGSISIDYYSFAWAHDPIVSGLIEQSGTVLSFPQATFNESATLWFNVTAQLGCSNGTTQSTEVLECMRKQNFTDILSAMATIGTAGSSGSLGPFGPTIDDEVVFSNYRDRVFDDKVAKLPLLIGNNDYEAGFQKATIALVPDAAAEGLLPSDSYWYAFNKLTFECPTALRAYASQISGTKTWRYRWFGNFPNLRITSVPDSGAYHGSEISILFGTADTLGPDTPAEAAIGKYLRSAWTSFAKDPENALTTTMNWPPYEPSNRTLLRLAFRNETGPNLGYTADYDYLCPFIDGLTSGGDHSVAPLDSIGLISSNLEGLSRKHVEELLSIYQT